MEDFEAEMKRVKAIVSQVIHENNGIDDPTDEFLGVLIKSCYKEGIQKPDAEFALQELYGDGLNFPELFNDVWTDLESELLGSVGNIAESNSALRNTPVIPDNIYKLLPNFLQRGAEAFDDPRQKDTFLISSLSVLSSILDNVYGLYSGVPVKPTLYSFIVAPAASGKGAMKYASILADPIHKLKKEVSEAARVQYEQAKREYDRKCRAQQEDPGEPPIEPKYKVHFIPGNSSSASIIAQLESNSGSGLIIETESDSLSNTFASEWGNFSDLLRKAFHHETVRSARKTNGEYKEIEGAWFSICLTGTPGQVVKLVESSENGLFSRIMFYVFDSPLKWIDASPKNRRINYDQYFSQLSNEALDMHQFFKTDDFEFTMEDAHWIEHTEYFSDQLLDVTAVFGHEASSVIKRLGLICFRIAMLFSAIEHFEKGLKQKQIKCSDKAFRSALSITKLMLEHALLVIENLPKPESDGFNKVDRKEAFFQSLPDSFRRSEAIKLAKSSKIGSDRTTDGLLRRWTKAGRLEKPRDGYYQKVQV